MLASHDLEQILILRKMQAKISEPARGVRSHVVIFRDLKTIRNTKLYLMTSYDVTVTIEFINYFVYH